MSDPKSNYSSEDLRDMTRPLKDAPVIEAEGAKCYHQCVELDGEVEQVINPSDANY